LVGAKRKPLEKADEQWGGEKSNHGAKAAWEKGRRQRQKARQAQNEDRGKINGGVAALTATN